jgi:autotransporter-associated beta strand protein
LNAADLTANLFPRLVQSSSGVIALTSTNATENVDFNAAGFTAAGLGAVGAVAYSGTLTPSGATYRLGGGGGTLTMSLADALTGARSLVVNGNVTLPAANNFAGGTTLNAGVLALGTDSSIGNGALTLGGGALQSADGGPRTLANTLNSLAGNVTIGGSGDVTFSDTAVTALGATRTFTIDNPKTTFAQQFSGAGVGITKAGAGILILSGANTYSGPTSVNGGTVRLANASGLGSTAAGTVVVLGELDLNGLSLGSETLTLNGSGIGGNGALTNSSAIAAGLSGAVALGSAAAIGGAGDITLSGAFDYGAFALTKTGADKLILGGPQTWGNGASATVQSGTLRYELGGSQTVAVGTGNSATIANAATLELAGSKSALSDGTRHVNVVNNSTSAAGLMIVGGTNQAVGGISGSGSTSVQANASLTADYIVQDTLTIGSGGSVTIRPMVSGLVAGSTYSAPTGYAGVTNLAGIGDAASITSGASLDSVVPPSGGFASVSIVPEPGLCVLLATAAACLGWRFRRRRPYSSSFCNSL